MTDPWGNPLPSDDRPPASPRPEDYPPSFPTMPPGPPEPPLPPPPAAPTTPAPTDTNPAWPGKQSGTDAPTPAANPPSFPAPQGPPSGTPVPPQYYPAPPYAAPPGPKVSGMAIASLVCGLAGLLCFGIVLAPTAFGLGLAARRSIRSSNGWRTGDGMAIAGIVLGIIGTILAIVTMVYVLKNPDYLDNFFNTTTTSVDTGLKGA